MLNPRQSSNEGHSVVPFRRRRRTAEVPARLLKPGSNVTILLSLTKYESDGQEDDYRHRMLVNLLALVVIVALVATGVWLASNLHD